MTSELKAVLAGIIYAVLMMLTLLLILLAADKLSSAVVRLPWVKKGLKKEREEKNKPKN